MQFKTVFLYDILSRDGFKRSKLLKIIFTVSYITSLIISVIFHSVGNLSVGHQAQGLIHLQCSLSNYTKDHFGPGLLGHLKAT